jgi:hypothetical protein
MDAAVGATKLIGHDTQLCPLELVKLPALHAVHAFPDAV